MLNLTSTLTSKSANDCSGCSLCLLVCPVWRRTRDVALTPHGRAKALQHGASAADIAASIDSCTLCMACDPVCPERIDLTAMLINLRRQLAGVQSELPTRPIAPALALPTSTVFLPAPSLRQNARLLVQITSHLGDISVHSDDGSDLVQALEAGIDTPPARLEEFLAPLRHCKEIIIADGLLLHFLRIYLPNVKLRSLGEALSTLPRIRHGLLSTDLYVIESRAYHSDYERLVRHYNQLRAEQGCAMNLDLQRIAIPATARSLSQRQGQSSADDDRQQGEWLLHGRHIKRLVVESIEEGIALEKITQLPVIHLAELG